MYCKSANPLKWDVQIRHNLYFSLILFALGVKNSERKGHRGNMELAPQSLFGLLCTALLIGWNPQFLPCPLPPHLGSYTWALLVSQDRRHLFVTPWEERRRRVRDREPLCVGWAQPVVTEWARWLTSSSAGSRGNPGDSGKVHRLLKQFFTLLMTYFEA